MSHMEYGYLQNSFLCYCDDNVTNPVIIPLLGCPAATVDFCKTLVRATNYRAPSTLSLKFKGRNKQLYDQKCCS